MKNIIKDFERILYNSLTYYVDGYANKAGSFKVVLLKYTMINFESLMKNKKK